MNQFEFDCFTFENGESSHLLTYKKNGVVKLYEALSERFVSLEEINEKLKGKTVYIYKMGKFINRERSNEIFFIMRYTVIE